MEESRWMNPHRNSKSFWSSGRKEKNSKTLLGCILSIMSAEKLGSGPRSFALSPGVCFSLGGVGFSLWWVISFSPFTFQAALRWQISLTGLGHRHENLSYWANRVSAEESIYGGENGGVWGTQKFRRTQLCIRAQTGMAQVPPPNPRPCLLNLITSLKGGREMWKWLRNVFKAHAHILDRIACRWNFFLDITL